ncbi:MAG: hypothetical protein V7L22_31790 [Nostoc sp.]|uniref:hypothetical protein n=1 Tax=Nostoc sp. TaxID=1180 RepID=UPI002FF8ABEE
MKLRSHIGADVNTTRFLHFELRIWVGEKVKGEGLKVFSFPFPPPLIPRGGMQQLRREVALDKTSIRSMIEEGRRF